MLAVSLKLKASTHRPTQPRGWKDALCMQRRDTDGRWMRPREEGQPFSACCRLLYRPFHLRRGTEGQTTQKERKEGGKERIYGESTAKAIEKYGVELFIGHRRRRFVTHDECLDGLSYDDDLSSISRAETSPRRRSRISKGFVGLLHNEAS